METLTSITAGILIIWLAFKFIRGCLFPIIVLVAVGIFAVYIQTGV